MMKEQGEKHGRKYQGILPSGQPHGRLVELSCWYLHDTSRAQDACSWLGHPQGSVQHGDAGIAVADPARYER
jgi:hypothetical protein